jgi:nicotinamide mononucleotide adenylyltransferase
MAEVGIMIHGRYQPFHLGHNNLLAMALDRSERICVGITNPDLESWVTHDASPHRHLPESNPFTYLERLQMVSASAVGLDAAESRVLVVPFPLDRPRVWSSYIPPDAVHLVPVFSDWEAAKVTKLRSLGHKVTAIDRRGEAKLSASNIRKLIADGGMWEQLVPQPVVGLVHEFLIKEPFALRVQDLSKERDTSERNW